MSRYTPVGESKEILVRLHDLNDKLTAHEDTCAAEFEKIKADYEQKLLASEERHSQEIAALKALLLAVKGEVSAEQRVTCDKFARAREVINLKNEGE